MSIVKPEGGVNPVPLAATASERNVFRDYARMGSRDGELEVDEDAEVHLSQDDPARQPQGAYVMAWRYIALYEIVGFISAKARDAGLEASALDEAVHTASEHGTPTQAREEDLELLSADATDVNNGGIATQVAYLVAQLGAQGAYEAVLAVVQEAEQARPVEDGPKG